MTYRVPHGALRLVGCVGAQATSALRVSTSDQTVKVAAGSAASVSKDGLRSEPPSCRAHRPSLPCLHSPSPPSLPCPTPGEQHNQLFMLSQQRERGREMLSTVTGQAPLSLQTFQEISGETRLLQVQGFQRSPLALAFPTRAGLGAQGDGLRGTCGPCSLAGQGSGLASVREEKAREQSRDALSKSPSASRRGPRLGNPSRFRSRRARKPDPHFGHSRPRRPTLRGREERGLYLPRSLTFSNKLLRTSSMGREAEAPREKQNPARRSTRCEDSPPRAAPALAGWGSEAPPDRPRHAAARRAEPAHLLRGAPAEKSVRAGRCARRLRLRLGLAPGPQQLQARL